MKHVTYEELFETVSQELLLISAGEAQPVKRLARSLTLIRSTLNELRTLALARPFAGEDDEIIFFKSVKPHFCALRIFQVELYNLDANLPVGPPNSRERYYQQELGIIDRFFKHHTFLYQYYRSGFTEMDRLYFLRGAEIPAILEPELMNSDTEFSTALDHLFARFIAMEQLRCEIIARMNGSSQIPPADDRSPKPAIKWTGSAVNLVELVYGLYLTGQLNNGNAEVIEIVSLMEYIFGFKLKDAHDTFGDIRERKVLSPTKFLDSMAAAVQQRVDDDLAYKPGRR